MRRQFCALAVAGAAVVAAPSALAAPPLPTGTAQDVVVKLSGRQGAIISFHRGARGLYRRVAGHRIGIACSTLSDGAFGPVIGSTATGTERAPKRRRAFRTDLPVRGTDLCVLTRPRIVRKNRKGTTTFGAVELAAVPLTQRGAVWVDERDAAERITTVAGVAADYASEHNPRGRFPSFGELQNMLASRVVALPAFGASPAPGATGYFTDGQNAVVATLTATGRRLYIELGPDRRIATNVENYRDD